jgi:hypothetical protein
MIISKEIKMTGDLLILQGHFPRNKSLDSVTLLR